MSPTRTYIAQVKDRGGYSYFRFTLPEEYINRDGNSKHTAFYYYRENKENGHRLVNCFPNEAFTARVKADTEVKIRYSEPTIPNVRLGVSR